MNNILMWHFITFVQYFLENNFKIVELLYLYGILLYPVITDNTFQIVGVYAYTRIYKITFYMK